MAGPQALQGGPGGGDMSAMDKLQALHATVSEAWLQCRYYFSKYFCSAEDLPLVEAAEFFCDCLPHSEELTIRERLQIMTDLRSSVRAAVGDLYHRQQEQRRRRQSRTRALAAWQRRDGTGVGVGLLDELDDEIGDSIVLEEGMATRTASLAMAIYAEQWEHLHAASEDRARPFQLRAVGAPQWQRQLGGRGGGAGGGGGPAGEGGARGRPPPIAPAPRGGVGQVGGGGGDGASGSSPAPPVAPEGDVERGP